MCARGRVRDTVYSDKPTPPYTFQHKTPQSAIECIASTRVRVWAGVRKGGFFEQWAIHPPPGAADVLVRLIRKMR